MTHSEPGKQEIPNLFSAVPELTEPNKHGRSGSQIDIAGRTDIGRMHAFRDDQYIIAEFERHIVIRQARVSVDEGAHWRAPSQGKLLAVANGMSGAGASEVASMATIDSVLHYITSAMPWILSHEDNGTTQLSKEQILDDLRHVLKRCENRLRRLAEKRGLAGPHSSAITLAYIRWPDLYVVHSSEGHCYLYRREHLYRIASEQSFVPMNNGVHVRHVSLAKGDRILLCTNSMMRHLESRDIARYLSTDLPSATVCERLVASAKSMGSTDNITAVVCRCQ